MKKLSRAARILAAAGLTLGLLGLAAPAHAEKYSIDDPADASGSLNDIYGLTYNHGEENVRFVIRVADLRRVSNAGATLYLDTKPDNKGPEYALGTGLSSGTDYALFRVEGWRDHGSGNPKSCDYRSPALQARQGRGHDLEGLPEVPATVAAAVKMGDFLTRRTRSTTGRLLRSSSGSRSPRVRLVAVGDSIVHAEDSWAAWLGRAMGSDVRRIWPTAPGRTTFSGSCRRWRVSGTPWPA